MSDVNQEFVSEDYDTSAVNMDDIRREIEQLSAIKRTKAGSPGNKSSLNSSYKYLFSQI
jgi:hypothetical protein